MYSNLFIIFIFISPLLISCASTTANYNQKILDQELGGTVVGVAQGEPYKKDSNIRVYRFFVIKEDKLEIKDVTIRGSNAYDIEEIINIEDTPDSSQNNAYPFFAMPPVPIMASKYGGGWAGGFDMGKCLKACDRKCRDQVCYSTCVIFWCDEEKMPEYRAR
jgi:hypothetical protein